MNATPTEVFTRENLLRRRAAVLALPVRRLVVLGLVFVVGLLLTGAAIRHLRHTPDPQPALRLAVVVAALCLPVALTWLGCLALGDERKNRTNCPRCHERVMYDITLKTHRCSSCGDQLVAGQPPAGEMPFPRGSGLTREQFAHAFAAHTQAGNWDVSFVLAVLAGGAAALAAGGPTELRPGAELTRGVVAAAFLVPPLCVTVAAAVWRAHQRTGRSRLRCPACHRSMAKWSAATWTLATGCCRYCDTRIFGNAPTQPDSGRRESPAEPPLDRDDLLRRHKVLLGTTARRLGALLLVLGVGVGAGCWIGCLLSGAEALAHVVFAASSLSLGLTVVTGIATIWRARDERAAEPLCPGCSGLLALDFALASGLCSACGTQITPNQPAPPARPTELPSRADLAQRFRTVRRQMGRCLAVAAALVIGGLVVWGQCIDAVGASLHGTIWQATLLPASLLLGGGWALASQYHLARRHGLTCPACAANLLIERRANLAIATGRCPCCGAVVVREGPLFPAELAFDLPTGQASP
jgi:ribosomal protein L37AE/L43A